MPATPAASTQPPVTPGGSDSRPTPSQTIQAPRTTRTSAFASAASTSARRQPKLRSGVAGRWASHAAKRASPSASASESMCAASASSASDPETSPAAASTPANPSTSTRAVASARFSPAMRVHNRKLARRFDLFMIAAWLESRSRALRRSTRTERARSTTSTSEIQDGEFLVLVGPSGCGKTTALRMVAGLEDISEGQLRIGDRVVNHVPPRDRDIAMVFQSYALYPHLTVYDNIAFGLKLKKVSEGRDRQARPGRGAGARPRSFLNRKPRALSGGQRQRVAMGRAIVREPAAFLMDEPLSNLDAKLRVQMRAEIAKLQSDLGTTTVYVTHDQVEAMTMGDRVAVMRKGELQQVARSAGALRPAR